MARRNEDRMNINYDAIVIGFGKGAKTLTGALAKQGKRVALIEKSKKMYGGTCINVGCIPSKSLVHSAAEVPAELSFAQKRELYAKAVAEKNRVTSMLRQKNYDKLAQLEGVTVYDGEAEFLSAKEVRVNGDGEQIVLEAEQIFINTGAEPVIPGIPGIKDNPKVFFSETMMDLEELPKHLILIGAGYIGMEFASMYRNFGSEVTVLQDGDVFLPREDDDIAAAIRDILEKRGINFRTGVKVQEIADGKVICDQGGRQLIVEGDAILIATGRKPMTGGLHPERAGVELTERGAVKVDDALRTTAPGIWAMGDVTGGLQFTYTSLDDYRVVAGQVIASAQDLKEYRIPSRQNVPYSVFMDTPLSRVGAGEKELLKQGISYKTLKLPAAAIPKAQVLRKTDGLLKAMIDPESGKILGAALLCEESYEMINIIKLAMDMGAGAEVLKNQIFTHPTMSEALNDLFTYQ